MGKAIYKVPNGKLLKIFAEGRAGKISALKITGDFFLYPEENLEALEKGLMGTELGPQQLKQVIEEFQKKHPTEFFGLDAESLVQTILKATS